MKRDISKTKIEGIVFGSALTVYDRNRRIVPMKEAKIGRKKFENIMRSVECCACESASKKINNDKNRSKVTR